MTTRHVTAAQSSIRDHLKPVRVGRRRSDLGQELARLRKFAKHVQWSPRPRKARRDEVALQLLSQMCVAFAATTASEMRGLTTFKANSMTLQLIWF